MPEIKNCRLGLYGKVQQIEKLGFRGLSPVGIGSELKDIHTRFPDVKMSSSVEA